MMTSIVSASFGGATSATTIDASAAACDPTNAASLDACGTVYAGLTEFARGQYDANSNVFTAYKIDAHLLEP